MPAMAGSSVPIFVFLIFVASIIVIAGTKNFKIAGICCLLLSITMLITDYRAGKEQKAWFYKHAETIESQKQN